MSSRSAFGSRNDKLDGEPRTAVAARATAAGVAMDKILDALVAELSEAAARGAGGDGTLAGHAAIDAVATVDELFARGGRALEDVFASTFSSPEEALAFVPEVVAGIMPEKGSASAATDFAGDPFARALRARGVRADEFAQAFQAALDDGLRGAVPHPVQDALIEELFAVAAAGAHAIPGAAAALDDYARRNQHHAGVRRWQARLRARLWAAGSRLARRRRLPLAHIGVARRVKRRRSNRLARRARARQLDGEPPRAPPQATPAGSDPQRVRGGGP